MSGGYTNDDLGKGGYEGFGLFSDTFAEDTLGILVSLTASERQLSEHGLSTFSGYGTIPNINLYSDAGQTPVNRDPNGDGVPGLLHRDPRPWQIAEQRDRLARPIHE